MLKKLLNKTWKKLVATNLTYLALFLYPTVNIAKSIYSQHIEGYTESYNLISFRTLLPEFILFLFFVVFVCINAIFIASMLYNKDGINKNEEKVTIKISIFEQVMLLAVLVAIIGMIQLSVTSIRDDYAYNVTTLQKDILINSIGVDNLDSYILNPNYTLKEDAIQERFRNKIINFHKFKGVNTIGEVTNYIEESKLKIDNMNWKIEKLNYGILLLFTILVIYIIYSSTVEEKKRKIKKNTENKEEVKE